MNDLEEVKRRKVEELQEQINKQQEEQLKFQKQIEYLENITKQYLTKEAISRYSNLKIVHPELAIKIIALIVQSIEAGLIKEKIDDNQFKEFLKQIQPKKKEFKIIRK